MDTVPQKGDKIPTWFSGSPTGMSTVISVVPYTGRYKEWFKWVVRATALNTGRGWMEFCC